MRSFRLKKTSLAVASVLAGALLAPQVGAVNLTTDGIGEVAIAPYYTTRDGWLTTINLINTSSSPIVVKVRIHEGRNSRDVFDFNVAMSSFDVFSGVLQENPNGTGPSFRAVLSPDVNGQKTCAIPASISAGTHFNLNTQAFGPPGTQNDDGGPSGTGAAAIDRMREGYIEFIVLGYTEDGEKLLPDTAAYDAIDRTNLADAIESKKCSVLDQAFSAPAADFEGVPNIVNTARQFGEPINALKFNFTLLNPARGVEAGNAATTWANFYNPAGGPDAVIGPNDNALCTRDRGIERRELTNWQPDGADGSCQNLITTQVQFDFLEPTLNDAYPQTANWWDDSLNDAVSATPTGALAVPTGVETVRGVDAVSLTIQRSDIINEWSNNPTLGVTTDWIVTLPTKLFYVDGGVGDAGTSPGVGNLGPGVQSAVLPSTGALWNRPETILAVPADLPYPPFAQAFGQEGGEPNNLLRPTARSCNEVGLAVFDRAEQRTAEPIDGGPIPSPAPPPVVESTNLCFEVNVVTFNDQTALNSIYPVYESIGGELQASTIDTSSLPGPDRAFGWMRMDLTGDSAGDQGGIAHDVVGVGNARGLPAVGFMLKQRTFGDVTKNYASSIDHAYRRTFDAP